VATNHSRLPLTGLHAASCRLFLLPDIVRPPIRTGTIPDLIRDLPKVELHFPRSTIGKNTVSSMQAGILFGAIDAMEGMVQRIQNELKSQRKKKAKVIATGGFSQFMAEHSPVIEQCLPSLVLDGVRLIFERVNGKPHKRA